MVFCACTFLYAVLASIPLLYWYFSRSCYTYWRDRGVSGPKPWPFFGNLIELFMKTNRRISEVTLLKKYGKIYGIFNGNLPVLTVADPDLIKNILVKDFHLFTDRQTPGYMSQHPILTKHLGFVKGNDWKRIRSIVSPAFTSGKMRKMYPMIEECLREVLQVLDGYAKEGRHLDLKVVFSNYTMDTIATCAFATKTNAHKDPDNPFIANAMKIFNPKSYRVIPLLIFPTFLLKLLNIKYSSDESANEFFFDLTRHLLNERKGSSDGKHNDFIQLLLNAQKSDNKESVVVRDVNDVNESHHVNEGEDELRVEKKAFSGVTDKYITEDEILANSWVFFNAGFETTATTLTFASHELALNDDIQRKLYEEVLTSVDSNGDIDYDLLSRLPYLDSVVSETLRLHSPAMRLTRKASEDYKLGETEITIQKGQSVEIPVYAIHLCEDFYPDPERFDPDRFMPENRDKLIPYTYLPFGAGPRHCVGMRFALMEIKVCLAHIIHNYKLVKVKETDVPYVPKEIPGMNSAKQLILGLEKR